MKAVTNFLQTVDMLHHTQACETRKIQLYPPVQTDEQEEYEKGEDTEFHGHRSLPTGPFDYYRGYN